MSEEIVYKICDNDLWQQAEKSREFTGAEIDLADGYIHFSTAGQVASTLARYFSGRKNLLMIAVDAAKLGDKLVYEPARDGDLFPHLYSVLKLENVLWVRGIDIDDNGGHILPDLAR